ncbi:uncharacterized protein N7515_010273 [Penicillium bovifimosum]|uniref:Uncharacterized protein n=1 Tax=Penicillium bovifimosum TaxID=126998 RepID=A0A9W9GI57_9EURO|nr:uncharacterized protein N7515_010273 [Penicillium bovifimosum]KAJ5120885.1 hypothetical protein N7515_010273 [Penicillium bovifimosum]
MSVPSPNARLFDQKRRAFIDRCNDVALFIMGNADLTISQLASFIVELRVHVTVLWLAGNVFLRDCYPDDLTHFPTWFMANVMSRLGRLPMTELAWGCFYTTRVLGWLP